MLGVNLAQYLYHMKCYSDKKAILHTDNPIIVPLFYQDVQHIYHVY